MEPFLPFPQPTLAATFVARPQRFLVDVTLGDGQKIRAYCANPGSFRGCLVPGAKVLLWDSGNTDRKRRYTWRAININGTWLGTDTHLANTLAAQALVKLKVPGLESFKFVTKEPRSSSPRLDFVVSDGRRLCFIEVKSATIGQKGVCEFPESVGPRSTAQLVELTKKALCGDSALLLMIAQRGDVTAVMLKTEGEDSFAAALRQARKAGVKFCALGFGLSPLGFQSPRPLEVRFERFHRELEHRGTLLHGLV